MVSMLGKSHCHNACKSAGLGDSELDRVEPSAVKFFQIRFESIRD